METVLKENNFIYPDILVHLSFAEMSEILNAWEY